LSRLTSRTLPRVRLRHRRHRSPRRAACARASVTARWRRARGSRTRHRAEPRPRGSAVPPPRSSCTSTVACYHPRCRRLRPRPSSHGEPAAKAIELQRRKPKNFRSTWPPSRGRPYDEEIMSFTVEEAFDGSCRAAGSSRTIGSPDLGPAAAAFIHGRHISMSR
jgi:hypothetical protein